MDTINVQASNARATDTGVERGVDVDVVVTLPDGRTVRGEVTLLPAVDGSPCYTSWGTGADHWVSGPLLAELYAATERKDGGVDSGALRSMLHAIRAEASEIAGDPS